MRCGESGRTCLNWSSSCDPSSLSYNPETRESREPFVWEWCGQCNLQARFQQKVLTSLWSSAHLVEGGSRLRQGNDWSQKVLTSLWSSTHLVEGGSRLRQGDGWSQKVLTSLWSWAHLMEGGSRLRQGNGWSQPHTHFMKQQAWGCRNRLSG